MTTKLLKSAGRFGVRYGVMVKRKTAEIEAKQRIKQICPFCGGRAVRTSKGIWNCKRCEKRFAGHAYFLDSKDKTQDQEAEGGKSKILKEEKTIENKAKEVKVKQSLKKEKKSKE